MQKSKNLQSASKFLDGAYEDKVQIDSSKKGTSSTGSSDTNQKPAKNDFGIQSIFQSTHDKLMNPIDKVLQDQLNYGAKEFYNVNLENFSEIFIVMESVESDLKKILQSVAKGTILEEDHIITMLYNSLCAINYMHSTNIIHRDLKPANLLVDSNCCVRLCDFGLARGLPTHYKNPSNIFQIKTKYRTKVI